MNGHGKLEQEAARTTTVPESLNSIEYLLEELHYEAVNDAMPHLAARIAERMESVNALREAFTVYENLRLTTWGLDVAFAAERLHVALRLWPDSACRDAIDSALHSLGDGVAQLENQRSAEKTVRETQESSDV